MGCAPYKFTKEGSGHSFILQRVPSLWFVLVVRQLASPLHVQVVVYFSFDSSLVIDQIFSLRAVETSAFIPAKRTLWTVCYEQKPVATVNLRLLWHILGCCCWVFSCVRAL